jgi:hypothetical protein
MILERVPATKINYGPIWLSVAGILVCLLSFNEIALRIGGHRPTVADDMALWAQQRKRVDTASPKTLVLLGASRIQTGFDLNAFKELNPDWSIIQLALNGAGSSFAVFKDIVDNSSFKGPVLVSEEEYTLSSVSSPQDGFVAYFHKKYSIDKALNRSILTWLQEHIVFLNPQSSSFRLWGIMLSKRSLPAPSYISTNRYRESHINFQTADTAWLWQYRMQEEIIKPSKLPAPSVSQWLLAADKWKPLVAPFQSRGGKVAFVHYPVAPEAWAYLAFRKKYWVAFAGEIHAPCIHFTDYPSLQEFKLFDTSHLDWRDVPEFTKRLVHILRDKGFLPS